MRVFSVFCVAITSLNVHIILYIDTNISRKELQPHEQHFNIQNNDEEEDRLTYRRKKNNIDLRSERQWRTSLQIDNSTYIYKGYMP